jgi:SHS2 domain-containing protein
MSGARVRRRPARRWGSFPTTADVGVWATGSTPEALLEALGLGLFAVITDLRTVRAREERAVSTSAEDAPSLVVAFLGELLLLQQTDNFLVRTLRVHAVGNPPTSVLASATGERFDAARHTARTEVKAVTFHGLVFDPVRGRARVILDI